jgi:molybdenum cofactor guanylyltransferase
VLAGGQSTRFGRDKLKEPHRGRPLLEHPIVALAEVCSEILVVVAPDADAPQPPPEVTSPVRSVRDAEPHAGPLAGLAAGLTETDTPLAVVVGGDMPGVSPHVLVELVLAASEEGVIASALSSGGEVRPLPCVVRVPEARIEARALLAAGERSLRALLGALDTRSLPEQVWRAHDPGGATLLDIDRPGDLES